MDTMICRVDVVLRSDVFVTSVACIDVPNGDGNRVVPAFEAGRGVLGDNVDVDECDIGNGWEDLDVICGEKPLVDPNCSPRLDR